MSYEIPAYTQLEIELTSPERIYSEDRIHRVYWHKHFLRGFDNVEDAKNNANFFKGFLENITYRKGM